MQRWNIWMRLRFTPEASLTLICYRPYAAPCACQLAAIYQRLPDPLDAVSPPAPAARQGFSAVCIGELGEEFLDLLIDSPAQEPHLLSAPRPLRRGTSISF